MLARTGWHAHRKFSPSHSTSSVSVVGGRLSVLASPPPVPPPGLPIESQSRDTASRSAKNLDLTSCRRRQMSVREVHRASLQPIGPLAQRSAALFGGTSVNYAD